MYIYYELNEKQKDVTVKNHKEDFSELRKLFEDHIIDFSSINKLKGNKDMLVKAFKEELYDHIIK